MQKIQNSFINFGQWNLLADVVLFLGKLHSGHFFQWPCVVQQDASREGEARQTRVKAKLDKIGTKKQIVKSDAKIQQEFNLRRHDQIWFQHLPWRL